MVVVADGEQPPDRLVAMCERADIPLFVTKDSAGHVIDVMRGHLAQHFAERSTPPRGLHGHPGPGRCC